MKHEAPDHDSMVRARNRADAQLADSMPSEHE
jgi:hypothetical protein